MRDSITSPVESGVMESDCGSGRGEFGVGLRGGDGGSLRGMMRVSVGEYIRLSLIFGGFA